MAGNYGGLQSTWFGLGVKSGGQLLMVGVEGVVGAVVNFVSPAEYEVYVQNGRVGPGLGGGVGFCFLFMLDCPQPHLLDGQKCSDWGIGLQLGNNWGAFISKGKDIIRGVKALEGVINKRKALIESGKLAGSLMKGLDGGEIEAVKTATGQVMNAYDSYSNSSAVNPKLLVLDSPFPGTSFGVELSAFLSGGFIRVQ